MPGLRGRLSYLAYRGAARVAQVLPASVAWPLARRAGRSAAYLMPDRRAMAAHHQRRATGSCDVRGAVRGVFASYGRYWLEMFRLPLEVRRGGVAAHFEVDGYEHITDALARGRGVVLALPHVGGWEWAAAWMSAQGHDLVAVVEALEPPELLAWFARQREAMGIDVVPLGPEVSSVLLRALRDNRIVCLVCDRDLTGGGVPVEFFGERTTLPAGPAALALRSGATLLPVAVYFRPGRGHLGVIRPPIPTERTGHVREDVARMTQDLAYEFERLIRAAPEQWHLLQPNWPSDRGERPRDRTSTQ